MPNVWGPDNGGVVIGDDEVNMVGGPTDHKDGNNQTEHLHNLKQDVVTFTIYITKSCENLPSLYFS